MKLKNKIDQEKEKKVAIKRIKIKYGNDIKLNKRMRD